MAPLWPPAGPGARTPTTAPPARGPPGAALPRSIGTTPKRIFLCGAATLAGASTGETMSTKLGRASRARELNNLFAAWKRAFELQDLEMMAPGGPSTR